MHAGLTNENGTCVKSIELEKNLHIIGVSGVQKSLIHNLLFKSSKGKTYGPLGTNEELH